jgi:hypothetical protein
VTEGTREQVQIVGGVSRRATAWLAWSLCALSLALTVLGLFLLVLSLAHPNAHVFDYWNVLTVGAIGSSPVGALIASRRPANPVGWIICSIGLIAGLEHFTAEYAIYGLLVKPGSLPVGEAAAWLASWLWVPGSGLLVFLLLLFPDGQLPSHRWRPFAWLTAAALGAGTVSWAFLPGPIDGLGPIRNPLGIEGAQSMLGLVAGVSAALGEGLLALVAAASLFLRMRHVARAERQQIKWFTFAVTVVALSFFLTYTVAEPISVGWLSWFSLGVTLIGVLCVPLSIAVAIFRYHLYDIDLLINRTVVYGSLTVVLAAVYLSGVTAVQAIFDALTGERSTLAVVASTLLIAALFNPLRRRIQAFIDRRFYRSKYDARKTLEAFSSKLRDETDLDALSDDLVGVVRDTMQPAHVSLWLRPDTSSRREQLQ